MSLLAPDFSTQPYWTDTLEAFSLPPAAMPDGPVDVVVVGGGYAGLSAALTLVKAGKRVVVCEASQINAGAAARAAGSLSHVPKASLPSLEQRYGRTVAESVYHEAREAREYVEDLIRSYQIDCQVHSSFRFVAAHSARAFEAKARALNQLKEVWGPVELIERKDQRQYIASDAFFGGVKVPNSATLQPAMLQRGLARAAVNEGAVLLQNTRVSKIDRAGGRFEVTTNNGTVKAASVFLATNSETGKGLPGFDALRKKLIVIQAFALATEEVDPERVKKVLPIAGPVSDTYKIINYIAPNADGRRFIVSARAGRTDGDMRTKAERMFRYFTDRFPDLNGIKVSNCWTGHFTLTADWIPHIGIENGVHYMVGCNGTGIPMSTYLGHKAGEKILGLDQADTVFDRPLPKLPFFGLGQPLLPLAVRGYAAMDRLFH